MISDESFTLFGPNVCFQWTTALRVCVCLDVCVHACSGWLHAYTPFARVSVCVHMACVCPSMCVWCVCMCVCMYVCGLKQLRLCVCVCVCATAKSLTIVTMKSITAKAAGALTCLTSWKRMRRSCTLRCSWKRDVDATRTTHPRCSSLHLF